MNSNNYNILDREWPKLELEHVEQCPMCKSKERSITIQGVKDWCFGCAPGSWSYFKCNSCSTVYLAERPNESSIGKAYTKYYTHSTGNQKLNSLSELIKDTAAMLKQGYLNYSLKVHLRPSIRLPTPLYRLLEKYDLTPRSFLQDIHEVQPGVMLDIGCGNGRLMQVAKKYGWQVVGLELDDAAAKEAKRVGLNVFHGSFHEIPKLEQKFDLIVCSHVLEHVHEPLLLISTALNALAEGGQAWIQWPNPESDGISKFSENWRGLEAPRHICLPSVRSVREFLQNNHYSNFALEDNSNYWKWAQITMYEDSEGIRDIRKGRKRKSNYFWSTLKFALKRKKLIQCELCTICIQNS